MRRVLGEVFQAEPDFEVAFARDGSEALAALSVFRPDVVTLDVHMPRMSGLECLDQIMIERPCPVVMISSLTTDGAEATLAALALGAVDFVSKPAGTVSLAVDEFAPVVLEKVRAAAGARLPRTHRLSERLRARRPPAPLPMAMPRAPLPLVAVEGMPSGVVIIGTSTGGPRALDIVLSALPADFPWPILVAQHMPAAFTASLAQRLDGMCPLRVVEVVRPVAIAAGTVYVARGDADMIASSRRGQLVVLPAPSDPTHRWHPSVDRLVASVTAHFPPERLIGVLMTGMGNDGAKEMTALRKAGGRTIAESEASAVVWGMPGELVTAGGAEAVVAVSEIADRVLGMVAG